MNQIQKVETQALAVASPDSTEIGRLMQHAIEKGMPVESLEKLAALYERMADRQAASEFGAAMASFQKACPPIAKTSTAQIVTNSGAKYSYQYAELDEIARTVGPLLHAQGLSYTWDCEQKGNALHVTCTLRHVNGHSVKATFPAPTESKAGMSEAQKYAAALTFARRQTLVQVLGLTTCDADNDGGELPAQHRGPISEDQQHELNDMLIACEEFDPQARAKFYKLFKISELREMKAEDFGRAADALSKKLKAKK